jgi:DNA polymerase I-like protein with 3'-5' exonuclease and polymerase domains
MPPLTYCTRVDWKKVGRVLRGEWPKPWPGFVDRPPAVWPRVSAFDTEFDPDTGVLERYSLFTGQGQPWVIEARDVRVIDIPDTVTVVMHNEDADVEHLQGFLRGGQIKTEDTMLMHAALWSDLPHTLAYLGSLYARINRWKHLFRRNPRVYSGGDALGTWDVYLALVAELKADPASARVYREELYPLNPIISEASNVGLRVHQWRVEAALTYHQRLKDELCAEVEAWAGYPLLLSSPDQVARHLYEVEKVGVKVAKRRRAHAA